MSSEQTERQRPSRTAYFPSGRTGRRRNQIRIRRGGGVKHGKKPTREQRKLIQKRGLDPAVWLVTKDTPGQMELVHRYSDNTTRTIHKGETE